ncbi:hypothetical protein ZWY2020_023578 [Hordeum vulgare]|nr:hypothetical protein ZWY2020_023578 [Hordeum vulgare]
MLGKHVYSSSVVISKELIVLQTLLSPDILVPCILTGHSARDRYLLQRERYDSVTRELKSFRLAKLLNVVYVLSMPFIAGPLILKGLPFGECEGSNHPLLRLLLLLHVNS